MKELPDIEWLRHIHQEAIKTTRRQTWTPFSPADLMKLSGTRGVRAISSAHDLIEVLLESLDRLEVDLHGTPPRVRDLWDKQQKKERWRPIDENALSDYVTSHLKRDLQESGIIANREVQIRPPLENSGQNTDIHIDAVIPSSNGINSDLIQCIIETKGCWNPGLKTAMQDQLVERYLKNNTCQYGIYLIGYFMCDSWDDRDYKKDNCPKDNIEDMAQRFTVQAKDLSVGGLATESPCKTLPGSVREISRQSTILIVDDFAASRRLFKSILRQFGFRNIIEAQHGQVAMEHLRSQEVGLIICDWDMPVMDGMELLREVRADIDLKPLPFIMVTGETHAKRVAEAIHAGVTNYVVKPCVPDNLLRVIKALMSVVPTRPR